MKKNYVSPTAEKIEFNYSEQVVASGSTCMHTTAFYTDGGNRCADGYQTAPENQA